MKRARPVTIKDIARELNISVATVSRAIRNSYDVSEETRNRVLEMSKDLNYRPNFNATGLVNHTSHNIAVILPHITSYYFSTVIAGIQSIAYKNGYNIILHLTDESAEREVIIARDLSLSSIDGILVSLTSKPEKCDHLKEIMNQGVPLVLFDRVAESIHASKVMQNDYEGAFVVVEHLIKSGYKNIAHITGPHGPSIIKHRVNGYLDALKKYNLTVNEEWIIHSEFNMLSGREDVKKLWNNKNKPDAIFAVNDKKAVGAVLELKEKKVVIGKDVGVGGFTNDPLAAIISPSITTYEAPALEVGQQCCELLLKHIKSSNFQPREVVIKGRLIVRESSKK
ncbi:MAG: LacI family DNA-binding transcriptional regulator [Chitinophagaceae bacterium]